MDLISNFIYYAAEYIDEQLSVNIFRVLDLSYLQTHFSLLSKCQTRCLQLKFELCTQALIDATSSGSDLEEESGIRMVALFDHEEVGSNSAQGAGSPVMIDAMSHITSCFSSDTKVAIHSSNIHN